MQVRAFLQLGKNDGKNSIAIAVDVAIKLMRQNGLTPKFTVEELRDNITQQSCGVRGQGRKFNQLDSNLIWTGKTIQLKVPVIHLSVFCNEDHLALAKSNYHIKQERECCLSNTYSTRSVAESTVNTA